MANLDEIKNHYLSAFARLGDNRNAPDVTIEFYAYIGLRHTIRIRDGRVLVRISDLMRDAPAAAHDALALILVSKLLRKRVSASAAQIYGEFARRPEIAAESQTRRKTHGRKIVTTAHGRIFDLEELFENLNRRYFQNELEKPVLTWSQRRTFRIFGHHDGIHKTISISKTLDDPRVPEFVVEYVLYHELLHIKHPTRIVNGRRQMHSAAFRRDERAFPLYDEAEEWLKKLAQQNQKTPKRKR